MYVKTGDNFMTDIFHRITRGITVLTNSIIHIHTIRLNVCQILLCMVETFVFKDTRTGVSKDL